MSYGKFTSIKVDEFINLDRVYRISLRVYKKTSFFWAFYLSDQPREFVGSAVFTNLQTAHEWLEIKLRQNQES
jgi:hypothetical protein